MIIAPITELTVLGIVKAGVPNQERIVIRPTEPVNLAQFGIILASQDQNGMNTPIADSFFWFGELIIEPPCWLLIYTGAGEFQKTTLQDTGHTAYVFHWGRPYTIFGTSNIKPILFRMDAILVGQQLLTPTRYDQIKLL
jgi:hypothetical protein